MADIELVIKLDKDIAQDIIDGENDVPRTIVRGFQATIAAAIKKGTPLPKGHGRIGDLDKLIKAMKERNDDNGGEPLNAVDRGYDLAFQHMVEESKKCVIIEADKGESEGIRNDTNRWR